MSAMDVDIDAAEAAKATNVFYRKTRKNKVRKIVREVYLRDDICCGVMECMHCKGDPNQSETLSIDECILVLDTNIVLHQMDFLAEDNVIDNVVVPYTVIQEARNRNMNTAGRMRALCRTSTNKEDAEKTDEVRRFHVFPNEFFRSTYVKQGADELINDRNDRAIREVGHWYERHLGLVGQKKVIVITNDIKSRDKGIKDGLHCMTVFQYVESMKSRFPNAGEKLASLTTAALMGEEEEDLEMEERKDEDRKMPDQMRKLLDKEAIYPAHLKMSEVTKGIKEKRFFQGVLRMNMNSCFEGKVVCHGMDGEEVIISGRAFLNRAIDGDVVALKLIDDNALALKQEEARPVGESDKDFGDKGQVESAVEILKEKEQSAGAVGTTGPEKKGQVIGIIKRNWREFAGTLRPLHEDRQVAAGMFSKSQRVFIPADPRIPFVYVQTRHSTDLDNKRIIVAIDSWDRFSAHPEGHWISVLGDVGDRDTESKVILHEHGVITREFSQEVLRCLPPADFEPDEEEIAKRTDFRHRTVCSIDPPGCKDIDDALHCHKLPNGNFEVGVHIADVTHFVKPDTPIDREAAERCTTVYLVEKRTDMLPGLLTTDLCSLVGNRQRLTFSCVWEMTPNADIVKTTCSRGIINSKAALSYAEAQARIDDPNDKSELTESIRRLNELAKCLRKKRFDAGALELASQEVKFELDSETADPTDVSTYQLRETNKLVEEFMLAANCSVAETILQSFPMFSVLRRHPPPKDEALKQLQALLSKEGFNDFKFGSNKELSSSLDALQTEDPFFNKLVRMLTCRTMNQAVYFCTGELDKPQYYHYGLAAPLYTHFTSPIRRYADVLVHRLLAAAIGISNIPDQLQSKSRISEQCDVINTKHRNAQWSGRASTDLHTYLYFNKVGSKECDSVVVRVRESGVQVVVPRYGIEGVVKLDKEEWDFNEDKIILTNKTSGETLSVFDHITVKITATSKNFRFKTLLDFVKKTDKKDFLNYEKEDKERQNLVNEMFPDKLGPDGSH